jgi:hypothetical protein
MAVRLPGTVPDRSLALSPSAASPTSDPEQFTPRKPGTIPIGLNCRPATPFNRPLTESLRDSANNPLWYGHPRGHLEIVALG